MPIHRDRAICLRNLEYSESSQIVTLLGRRAGLFRAIVKGAHRRTKAGSSKFDGGIDLLDVGDCVFISHTSRELSTLTEWKQLSGQLSLHRSLRGMLLGQAVAEAVPLLLAEHDPHPQLYDRMRATLPILSTDRVEEHAAALLIDLLNLSGFLPDIDTCGRCGNPISTSAFYTSAHAGVLCGDCAPAFPDRVAINPRLLRGVPALLALPRERGVVVDPPRLTPAQSSPLIDFLLAQIEQIAQKPLRTRSFLRLNV